MHLSPSLYHWMVRPEWFTKKYIHDHIEDRFSLTGKDVLDFGCGTGANSRICDQNRYSGIDVDARRIRYAKKLYPKHSFAVFDGNRIPLQDRSVDLVMIVAVLHHLSSEQIAGYLKEFRRVLKPGGSIIAIEPCLCQNNRLGNWFMKRCDNGAYIRNEDDYLQLFQEQQYECQVIRKFTKCFLYNEFFFTASPVNTWREEVTSR